MIIRKHFHKKGFALGLVLKQRLVASQKWSISHVLNKQETGFESLKLIGVKSESYHMKEHPKLIQIVKFEHDWRKGSQW